MAGGFETFDCPVRKNDSELYCVLSILAQRLKGLLGCNFAIVWVYPLEYTFEVGKTLQGI